MRVLLDTSVLCDWLLERDPWQADAVTIAEWAANGRLTCLLTATSVVNLHYLARKLVGRDAALSLVERCLRSCEVWPVDAVTLRAAAGVVSGDFEDNVQIAVAEIAKADCIVTRDARGFRRAIIPVFSPVDFLHQLHS